MHIICYANFSKEKNEKKKKNLQPRKGETEHAMTNHCK
jgi:hypothetical protein